MAHECNSRCHPPVHLDVVFAQKRLEQTVFEAALQSLVEPEFKVRVVREVLEYDVPEDVCWHEGPYKDQLLTEYLPVVAFLVEYIKL